MLTARTWAGRAAGPWSVAGIAVLVVLAAAALAQPASGGEGAGGGGQEPRLFRDELRDGQRRLAQSVLSHDLRNRESVHVKQSFTWKVGKIQGSSASTFRSFNQSFVLVGRVLYQLEEGSESSNFTVKPVAEFQDFLGEVAFVESVEWDGLLHLVAAYKHGLLQLFTVTPEKIVKLHQSIKCDGIPTDAEFFVQDESLFLVVTAQNSLKAIVVYRWRRTQLDEEAAPHEIDATAVSTFPFQESVIIVAAVGNARDRKAGLVVFRYLGSKLELVGLLHTPEPSALQHFTFKSENFILVTSAHEQSTICWWTGSDLAVWGTLRNEGTVHSIGVGYVLGETLLLLAEEAKIKIYRPSITTLELLAVQEVNIPVHSATLFVQEDSIYLLTIAKSAGNLVPSMLKFSIKFQPEPWSYKDPVRDPLLQCFSSLDNRMKERDLILREIVTQRPNLLRKSSRGQFHGKLLVKKLERKAAEIQVIVLNGTSTGPVVGAHDLLNQIANTIIDVQTLTRRLKTVVFKSSPSTLAGRLEAVNLKIVNAHMDSVFFSELNGQIFNPEKLLKYSKDQKLTGTLSVKTLATDNLLVASLNDHKIDDLLKHQGNQVVAGLELVTNVRAKKISISSNKAINGVTLRRIATTRSPGVVSISGTKTFSGLNLEQLAINLLNNVNFTSWIESLRPQRPLPPVPPTTDVPEVKQTSGNLKIQDLTVTGSINGVQINDLLNSLFLKGLAQQITGFVQYDTVDIRDLEADVVNGIPSSYLLTRTTDQTIKGRFSVEAIAAPQLDAEKVNGVNMKTEAVYVNSPFLITAPVTFEHIQSRELVLPRNANVTGQPIGLRLFNQPKIIYEGKVKVKGTLKLTDANLQHARILLKGTEVDLPNIWLNYWTNSGPQVIMDSLHLSTGLSVRYLTVQTINGFSPENFVYLSSTKRLQGTWHFPSATIYGDLVHDQSATQFPISLKELESIIVRTTGNYNISGSKTFKGGLSTPHLITQYLDSKKVSDLLRGRNRGSSYAEIWVGGNLRVQSNLHVGSVNKRNLCDRLSKAVLIDKPSHIPSAVISAFSASNINVTTFNGVPFDVIAGRWGETPVQRVRKISITGDVYVPAFKNVLKVNNKPATREYLSNIYNRIEGKVIHGRKTFASLHVEGGFVATEINDVKLEDLFQNVLSKTRNQTISARITMKDMTTKELKANKVNNIEVGNLLSSDVMSRQTIEGDLIFTSDLEVLGHISSTSFGKGCDLKLVAERLEVLDGRHWAAINIEGSLVWETPLPMRVFGLGYYLGSAVTKNDEQIILGDVSFENTVFVHNFDSHRDINDISIPEILADSLKKSLPKQVVLGRKVFSSKLHSTSMRVLDNVVAKRVANVVIATFNSSLVRIDGDKDIGGTKRFLQGFSADLLKVSGTVNGLITSEVASYDLPLLPPIHFIGPVEIIGNLHFERVNGNSLDDLLLTRVTLDSPQELRGHITFHRDLTVSGDMIAPSINNVDIADLIQKDSLDEQIIGGVKHFTKDLGVSGSMLVDTLDNIPFRYAYDSALFVDENATIYGDLVCGNSVTMEGDLNVVNTVNDVPMDKLAEQLATLTPRSFDQITSIARTINETNTLLKARGDLSHMLYLEPVSGVPMSFTNTYRVTATDVGGNETYLDVYGWASNELCGLPIQCACSAQYSVHIGNAGLGHVSWSTGLRHKTSERSFTFHLDDPYVTLMVKTNTISSSPHCRRGNEDLLNEATMLSWVERNLRNNSNEAEREINLHIDPSNIFGFISDVKVMVVEKRIYLVLGIAYDPVLDTNNLESVIVHVDLKSQRARRVAKFPTYGVSTLDVFYSKKVPHIVVGNSYNSQTSSSQVPLDVYSFSSVTEQLTLVKSIPAEGILSVVSIVQGGDSLIVVGQKQLYTPVMVLKYDSAHKDYHFIQQLSLNTIPTGLGVFYVGQPGHSDAFLGVSTADQFYMYKFCHIEGFKQVMQMELEGAQGFSSFTVGSKQYLFFSSSGTPSIFEIVKQSS